MKIKAIYIRKSQADKDNSQDTLKTHKSVLVRLASQSKWEFDLYEEIARGDEDKDELNRLRDNLVKYDAILCMDIDRLSRSKVEAFQLELELAEAGVKVITPNGTYDFADDSQNMMYSFKAIFASAEHKKIKKRMKDGKINRFKNGEYSIGKPPFGYDIVNKRLEINEDEAQIVRQIFKLSAEGNGRHNIADITGVSSGQVRWILQNKAYIGTITLEVKNASGDTVETLIQACPEIVDIETYVKAQEEIKRRDRNPARTRGVIMSFLQGLFVCTSCGNQMRVSKSATTILKCNTPKCTTNGIKIDYVENYIINELDTALEVLYGVLEDRLAVSAPNTLGQDINALKSQIEALEAKLKRIKDLHIEGDMDKTEFKERKSAIDKDISEFALKLKVLEIKQAQNDNQSDVQEIKDLITDLQDFPQKQLDNQHQILKRLIDKIDYTRTVPKGANRKTANDDYPPLINIHYRAY